ncbi:MAG TPA: hypothetical protein PLA68_12575 [Panacibacter sp.]|nr:hypothetical protein [Panacibacter sp.]
MKTNNQKQKTIAEHVFNGATTMAGVCVTIIALFRVMKMGISTYADEVLAADTCIFIAAALLSYMALRKDTKTFIENIADILFFLGMAIMMLVGILIVYSTY